MVVWGRRIALASGVVFLLFGLNLVVREFEVGRAQEAVVLQPQVDVLSAPLDDETLTILRGVERGRKVRVGPTPNGWTVKYLCFLSVPKSLWSQKLPLCRRRRGVEACPAR